MIIRNDDQTISRKLPDAALNMLGIKKEQTMNTRPPTRERERLAAQRLAELNLPQRICNSSVKGHYTTGMGETPIAVRPGAMRAFELPSRGL